jgi:hypothetical protein
MNHELWQEPDGCQTFCLAGAQGDGARALMHSEAKLVWEVEAESHFEAMTKYYAHMQWGEYPDGLSRTRQDLLQKTGLGMTS